MQSPYVAKLDLSLAEKFQQDLKARGFEISKPAHTFFQAKTEGISCTLYLSGKLVVQGKKSREFIEFFLEPEVLGVFNSGYEELSLDFSSRIGVDESGKGDFFGPLCIAGVYADENTILELSKLGVKDSKKLSDPAIEILSQKIKKKAVYHIVRISPKRYNELYDKFANLNLLLGWGHATVIDALITQTGCQKVLIDQFAAEHVVETALKRKNKKALLIQKPRGEEDIVVAAASILARSAFLQGLEKMRAEFQMDFPKGASLKTLEAGKKLLTKYGPDIFSEVAKLHFKTTKQILTL